MKFNKRISLYILISALTFFGVKAQARYLFSGQASHRFYFVTDSSESRPILDNWVRGQQNVQLSSNQSLRFQFYGYGGDRRSVLYQDLDQHSADSLSAEAWMGDTYYQFTQNGHLLKIGYQTFLWQEGLGLSYTNFINSRDYRISYFDSVDRFNRSAPAISWLYTRSELSLQAVYLPFSQYDFDLPASRTSLSARLPVGIESVELKGPSDKRADNEWGARLSWAGEGFDFSAFYFELKDRKLTYRVGANSTLTSLILEGEQRVKQVVGIATSAEVAEHVMRAEVLQLNKRDYNLLSGATLARFESDELAATVGIDSPGAGSWSYSLQHSLATLTENPEGSIREKEESFSYLTLIYDLKKERKIQFQGIVIHHDRSQMIRASYYWPLSKSSEAEIAYEGYAGQDNSIGQLQKEMSHIFLQITHTF